MTLAQNHQQQLNGNKFIFLFLLKIIIFNNRYSNGTIFFIKIWCRFVIFEPLIHTLTLMKYFFSIYIPFFLFTAAVFTGKVTPIEKEKR
jgi:hypothetical protein